MTQRCERCDKELEFMEERTFETYDGKKMRLCLRCYGEAPIKDEKKKLEEYIKTAPKIKCPYCEQCFLKPPSEKYKYSLAGNITRGIVFLPWGVVKSIKNRPYIECPHCKMKIMQG